MNFIVEQHPDGYVAYPMGLEGVVVGQGDTREAALLDAQSAAKFHCETFAVDSSDGIEADRQPPHTDPPS